MTTRNGRELRALPAGDRRRLSDARNAWRKMTAEQRAEFLAWIRAEQEQAQGCPACRDGFPLELDAAPCCGRKRTSAERDRSAASAGGHRLIGGRDCPANVRL
jgi:hypothetical protein